jgi:hypothetical protein
MTIITEDGRTVKFCGGDDTIVDSRVAERRVIDHNVPEQREADRRAEVKPEPRKSTAKSWQENWEGRNIQLWMEDLLGRIELMVGIDYTVIHQDGTEEEVHVEQSLSASAGR